MRKGINYDVGTFTRGPYSPSSRDMFDKDIVQREMEIIKNDLHCGCIRISGQDIERLTFAAEAALKLGMEVWLSPAYIEADQNEMSDYLTDCAKAAEKLRLKYHDIILILGCELTFFMNGLVSVSYTHLR
ncbi:MAG: abortive infection protein, partial [Clostridiales bacterium]|nr:abortive infection protein [Clostridiales bacterium]